MSTATLSRMDRSSARRDSNHAGFLRMFSKYDAVTKNTVLGQSAFRRIRTLCLRNGCLCRRGESTAGRSPSRVRWRGHLLWAGSVARRCVAHDKKCLHLNPLWRARPPGEQRRSAAQIRPVLQWIRSGSRIPHPKDGVGNAGRTQIAGDLSGRNGNPAVL